jgi:hypothetical protein
LVVNGTMRTETVTTSAGTTVTSKVQTVTQTSANSVTRTTTSDLTDGTTLDLTTMAETVTNPVDGSTTTTQSDRSADTTLLDETDTTVTPTSGGGQVTSATTSERNGDGTLTVVDQQATTISTAGPTQTTTTVDMSGNGTERSRSAVTRDAQWSSFRVWQDANQDGLSQPGEVKTLAQLGITGIDLNPTGPAQQLPDGSMIQGLSTFTRADGTTGTAGDVMLSFTPSGSGAPAASSGPVLSSGMSVDAGVAQLINALAGHPAGGEADFEAPEIMQNGSIGNPVPTLAQALHG